MSDNIRMWKEILFSSFNDAEFTNKLTKVMRLSGRIPSEDYADSLMNVFLERAEKYLFEQDFDSAESITDKLLRFGPHERTKHLKQHIRVTRYRFNNDYENADKECLDYVDLGIVRREQRLLDESIELLHDIDTPAARTHLAYALMAKGQWKEGLKEHEWRFHYYDNLKQYAKMSITRKWRGEPIKYKTLLVYGEQGMGDVIMFSRFLKRLDCRVLLECNDSLKRLLSQLGCEFYDTQDFDYHCSMMSLPYLMDDYNFDNESYLQGSPTEHRGIGIVWQGNRRPDPRRSVPYDCLKPLFDLPCKFNVLQWGAPDSLVKDNFDFQDTANIIAGLDTVITCDTSVAHLAGAMGKKTLLMLPYHPDWRWENPWYKSVIVFRQDQDRDWTKVVQSIKSYLE